MLKFLGIYLFLLVSVSYGQALPESVQPLTPKQMEEKDRFEWRSISTTTPAPQPLKIARVRQAIEGRTSLIMHPEQQWVPYAPETFRQYPFLHWEMCGTPPPLSLKSKLHFRDFFIAGGTLYLDHCPGTPFVEEWKAWTASIFPKTQWASLNASQALAFSFYLLEKRMLLSRGRTFIDVLENDGRFIMVMNRNPEMAWKRFRQAPLSRGLNSRNHEISLRFYINFLMYTLTGNYKADQLHLPTILLRRK